MITLWTEGYAVTGDSQPAQCHGTYMASTLRDAVDEWASGNPERERYLNADRTAYWGCRFFDNEVDARARFG